MQPDSDFDSYAANYDEELAKGISVSGEDKDYFAKGRIKWLAGHLAGLKFTPHTVLDFGCGTGGAIPFLFDILKAKKCFGIDSSEKSIQIARKHQGSYRVCFESANQFLPCGEMDLVFCSGVFHHIPPGERHSAMATIFEALRPEGLIALYENNPWNPGTRYVMSRISFDRDAITLSLLETRRMFRDAGFEILESDFLFFFPRSLRWFRCLDPKLRKIPLGAQYLVLARKPVRP